MIKPRILASFLASFLAISLLSGCAFVEQTPKYPSNKTEVLEPKTPYVGVYLEKEYHSVRAFEAKLSVDVNSLTVFRSFGRNKTFKDGQYRMLKRLGVVPIISLEPWDPRFPEQSQKYSLKKIIQGDFDSTITAWAQGVATYKEQVMLRFAHEMNGPWYPWGVGVNGNTPEQYIQAWRHVHDIFESQGATNVSWVWSPNMVRPTSSYSVAEFYPGDDYVDMMGIVGYATEETDTYESLFGLTLDQMKALSSKPIIYTETGVDARLKNAGTWITDFFDSISEDKQVVGFEWFNADKRRDWRLIRPAAKNAFTAGVEKFLASRETGKQ